METVFVDRKVELVCFKYVAYPPGKLNEEWNYRLTINPSERIITSIVIADLLDFRCPIGE